MVVYTIGSSVRSIEEFLEILEIYGIKCVIDVRRFPTSRLEYFKREKLFDILNKQGIKYCYLGKELGGYRRGGYEAYMKTETYLKTIERLQKIVQQRVSVIMCAERLPWRCHRRFIAQGFVEKLRCILSLPNLFPSLARRFACCQSCSVSAPFGLTALTALRSVLLKNRRLVRKKNILFPSTNSTF